MTAPIPVTVRYIDHTETILIAPDKRRCAWHVVKPKRDKRAEKTQRIVDWFAAYWRNVGEWPTNARAAEALGCSVSTIGYHLRKANNSGHR